METKCMTYSAASGNIGSLLHRDGGLLQLQQIWYWMYRDVCGGQMEAHESYSNSASLKWGAVQQPL